MYLPTNALHNTTHIKKIKKLKKLLNVLASMCHPQGIAMTKVYELSHNFKEL